MKIVAIEPLGISHEKVISIERIFKTSNHEVIFYPDKPTSEEQIIERAKDADIIITANIPISENVIKSCIRLRLISVAFTGVDHIDLNACKFRGIKICNAAGYSTNAVAELTIGMIISLMRKIPLSDYATRTSKSNDGFLGTELNGKTIGIIGTGKIGSKVAQLCNSFGCKVLAFSNSKKQELENIGVQYVPFEQLLLESDVITLHVPLNDSTLKLIGKDQIMYMKQNALLINTSRGAVIDTMALSIALKIGRISGAALDVYDIEPPLPPAYPLREFLNTVLLPHIGYATQEAIAIRTDIVINNIVKWMEGEPQNVVL